MPRFSVRDLYLNNQPVKGIIESIYVPNGLLTRTERQYRQQLAAQLGETSDDQNHQQHGYINKPSEILQESKKPVQSR